MCRRHQFVDPDTLLRLRRYVNLAKKAGVVAHARPRNTPASEIVFKAQLDAASPYLGPTDDAKISGAVAIRRIAENRVIARVRSFQAELKAVAFPDAPVLQQSGVQSIELRPANAQSTRRGGERVRSGTREGVLVEVAVEAVVDRTRTRRITQQVGALRAVPQRASGLADLDRETGLKREEAAQLPAADDAVHDAAGVP